MDDSPLASRDTDELLEWMRQHGQGVQVGWHRLMGVWQVEWTANGQTYRASSRDHTEALRRCIQSARWEAVRSMSWKSSSRR